MRLWDHMIIDANNDDKMIGHNMTCYSPFFLSFFAHNRAVACITLMTAG